MTYATAWHCDYVGDVTPTGMDCTVTATSTEADGSSNIASSSPGNYNGPTYNEWLLVACLVIFFMAYQLWRTIFSKPRT